jgi:hypothetical protein
VAPVSCWDHYSHKGFAPGLSKPSTIKLNTAKNCGVFDLYLIQTRLKFETTAIDSNFMHLSGNPMKPGISGPTTPRGGEMRAASKPAKAASGNAESAFKA